MHTDNINDKSIAGFPKPTSDGFFFEDEINETMGIESQVYENGKEVRRVTLSNGTKCIVRQLTGKEIGTDVQRLTGTNQDNYQYAMVSVSTKFGDVGKTMEDIMDMLGKDYLKLQVANSQVNF